MNKSKNNRPEEYDMLSPEEEQLVFKVQALVDNEIPEEEIPEVMSSIEGDYRLRGEYVRLLQLKRQLAGLPKLALRKEWYEEFERRKSRKAPMYIGSFFAVLYAIWSLLFFGGEVLGIDLPRWLHIAGLFSLTAGIVSFLINAIWQRGSETRSDRSYKDVMR
jgi:hypothetical protein